MSLSVALQKLAAYRKSNTRKSQETFQNGLLVLEKNGVSSLGDDSWSFLEQLTLASIDVGKLDVADRCLEQLAEKFPASPRVDVLVGIRMEATEPFDTVMNYYAEVLDADSANAAAWKRKVTVLRRANKIDKAVTELSQFLDTFYADVEGWLELADIYTSCSQYTSALQALTHVLLLAPQNPFYTLQFAETAYTAGDLPLALKMLLLVIDMCERDSSDLDRLTGVLTRAWWATKLCTRHLMTSKSTNSASHTSVPKNLNLIDELATEQVLKLYSSGRGEGRDLVTRWLGQST
ncbi:hypothetical protein HGRIS_012468 [Hohenbuehelia grisea]|uniref:ER membrane protein complex subunit 2 n=1 Tax=Hohenbuehelia grisea TaxID=104357 RepID=A0ABR3ISG7_9AGAR